MEEQLQENIHILLEDKSWRLRHLFWLLISNINVFFKKVSIFFYLNCPALAYRHFPTIFYHVYLIKKTGQALYISHDNAFAWIPSVSNLASPKVFFHFKISPSNCYRTTALLSLSLQMHVKAIALPLAGQVKGLTHPLYPTLLQDSSWLICSLHLLKAFWKPLLL